MQLKRVYSEKAGVAADNRRLREELMERESKLQELEEKLATRDAEVSWEAKVCPHLTVHLTSE